MRLSVFINEPVLAKGEEIYSAYGRWIEFFAGLNTFEEIRISVPLKKVNNVDNLGQIFLPDNIKIIGLPFYEGENEVVKKFFSLVRHCLPVAFREAAQCEVVGYNSPSLIGSFFGAAATLHGRYQFELIRGNNYDVIKDSYRNGLTQWFYLAGYHIFDAWMDVLRRHGSIVTFTNGEALKKFYDHRNPRRVISTFGPGLDSLFFEETGKHQKDSLQGLPTALYVGRLSREKGLDYLIQAAGYLWNIRKIRFNLRIVGRGPDEHNLKNLVKKYGLGSVIQFPGFLHGCDLVQEYDKADTLVVPSLTEGTPMVIPEAMARGVPIIATRVGGIPWMIEDGKTGILVEPFDWKQLADAIELIFTDFELRNSLAQNCYEKANLFNINFQRRNILLNLKRLIDHQL